MGSGGSNALWSSRNSVARMSVEHSWLIRICDICDVANFRVVSSSPPQFGFRAQIAWVLYGQASRAISIG